MDIGGLQPDSLIYFSKVPKTHIIDTLLNKIQVARHFKINIVFKIF